LRVWPKAQPKAQTKAQPKAHQDTSYSTTNQWLEAVRKAVGLPRESYAVKKELAWRYEAASRVLGLVHAVAILDEYRKNPRSPVSATPPQKHAHPSAICAQLCRPILHLVFWLSRLPSYFSTASSNAPRVKYIYRILKLRTSETRTLEYPLTPVPV
jgi:hypothetical protein